MIRITLSDGSVREYEQNATGFRVAKGVSPALAHDVISCGVNSRTVELNRPTNRDTDIVLYKFDDEEGKHIFWHTSTYLLAEALQEFYPGIQFEFGSAVESGPFYGMMPAEGQTISENDFPKVEEKMRELAKKNEPVVRCNVSKAGAVRELTAGGREYKVEHIVGGLESGTISTYSQGNLTNLYRGLHLVSVGTIKTARITSVAGALWCGDAKCEQITRTHGITFFERRMSNEYLEMLEEARKRDHRKIGKGMELFMFSDRADKDLPIWLPKGMQLRLRLQGLLCRLLHPYNYQKIITPSTGGKNLYVTSGRYAHYGKDVFQLVHTPEGDEEYTLKSMSCPHHREIYVYKPCSCKGPPLRIVKFGTVSRYEKSGGLHKLTRVRAFTQDDAHIFACPNQMKAESESDINIILRVFEALGFDNHEARTSLRDPKDKEKYISSNEVWEESEAAIKEVYAERGLDARVELGEAAFYGSKLNFMVGDAIGHHRRLDTIQVDYNLPNHLRFEYTAEDNSEKTLVMVHHVSFGLLGRFTAALVEHTADHSLLWLIPDQVAILPVSEKYNDYAQKMKAYFGAHGTCSTMDGHSEKIGRKIHGNKLERTPYIVIVDGREATEDLVSIHQQGSGGQTTTVVEASAERINNEVAEQPKGLDQ